MMLNYHLWASTKFTISHCSRTSGVLKFILVLLVHVEMLCSALDLTLVISNYTPVACMLLDANLSSD
jgi:hypothetical protein